MPCRTPAKQISKSRETMDIYAPLAHRLGMREKIKWELEDASLKYLEPEGYASLTEHLNARKAESDRFMKAIQSPGSTAPTRAKSASRAAFTGASSISIPSTAK